MAYIFAKEQMNEGITWESCCCQSCLHLNVCGIRQITDWNVLERWNIAFRLKECFHHPNPNIHLGKIPEPLLFQAYPSIKEDIRDHILTSAIPKCMQKDGVPEAEKEAFLQRYHLKTVSPPTVYRWMTTVLGFKYCNRQKTYYLDGHEWEDVVIFFVKDI